MVFRIDEHSKVVEALMWVPVSESEEKLSLERTRFTSGGFELIEPTEPKDRHFVPSDVNYVDQKSGVSIFINRNSNQVYAINFHRPKIRGTASGQGEKELHP